MVDKKPKSKARKPRKLQKIRRETNATWASTLTFGSSRAYAEGVEHAEAATTPAAPELRGQLPYFSAQQILLLNLSTIPIMFLTLLDASIISTVS